MDYTAIIQMPKLRAQCKPPCQSFSPGISADSNSWCPPDYPLSPAEAAMFLKNLASIHLEELETMRHAFSIGAIQNQFQLQQEFSALDLFAQRSSQRESPLAMARKKAQLALLWQWHMETLLEEISELVETCQKSEAAIPVNFCEEEAPALPQENGISNDLPSISWETTLGNAAFFLSPHEAIHARGPMAEMIAERVKSKEAGELGDIAIAPLWQILGHSPHWINNIHDTAIKNIFSFDRIWIYRA